MLIGVKKRNVEEWGVNMTTYYTKLQTEMVLKLWYRDRDMRDVPKLPEKGDQLIVAFPNGKTCTITPHDHPSTYGKPLFKLVFS
jgi:hypothetical protein